jgi:heat shock protein HslJ
MRAIVAGLAVALLGAVALTACGGDGGGDQDAGAGPAGGDLTGVVWLLDTGALDIEGAEEVAAELQFTDEGRVSGSNGCNRLSGAYEADGEALRFGPLATTEIACIGAANTVASAVDFALGKVRAYGIAGDVLTLRDAAGSALLTYREGEQGVAGDWDVVSVLYDDAIRSVTTGTELTASFGGGGEVSGETGCNRFTGPFGEDGEELRVGPLSTTRRACTDEDAAKQERGYLEALASVVRSERVGDRLTLFDAQGRMAVTLTAAR